MTDDFVSDYVHENHPQEVLLIIMIYEARCNGDAVFGSSDAPGSEPFNVFKSSEAIGSGERIFEPKRLAPQRDWDGSRSLESFYRLYI